METLIRTFCDLCAKEYGAMFTVRPYPGVPTTEKRQKCEGCGKTLPADLLRMYVISGKGKKKK